MLFVKSDKLKAGMRLAKPIYNKNGVMLYERNSKLTSQGIVSIQNFELIGVYVLEPAEPVPPMTEDDIEFERFQAISVFAIRDILDAVSKSQEPKDLFTFANQVLKNYGSLNRKINFIQNLRSREDYVYKHSLNTAILCSLISHRLKLEFKDQLDIVIAALLHDVGSLMVPVIFRNVKKEELSEANIEKVNAAYLSAYQLFSKNNSLTPEVRRILTSSMLEFHPEIASDSQTVARYESAGTKILKVAYTFDNMTAMNFEEEPLSEIAAVRYLLENEDEFDRNVINALLESINILQPGVCVELTNGDKGLVIAANDANILEPFVLSFKDNQIYNLGDKFVAEEMQIKDIMKTMDNRHVVDNNMLSQYTGKTIHVGDKL